MVDRQASITATATRLAGIVAVVGGLSAAFGMVDNSEPSIPQMQNVELPSWMQTSQ